MDHEHQVDTINQFYHNKHTGLSSNPAQIQKELKKIYPQQHWSLDLIKDVISRSIHKQVHQKINKDHQIPITAPSGYYQADLLFYEQYKRVNKGHGTILAIIDINTRYAYAYPLKNKTAKEVSKAMEQFIKDAKDEQIAHISFDKGKEFQNSNVKNLLDEEGIKYQFYDKKLSPNAMMMVERFNRSLRMIVDNYMKLYDTHVWYDSLDAFIDNYNNKEHQSIKMSPNQARKSNFIDIDKLNKKQDALNRIARAIPQDDEQKKYLIQNEKQLFKKGNQVFNKAPHQIDKKDGNAFIMDNGQRKQAYQLKQYKEPMDNAFKETGQEIDEEKYAKELQFNRRMKREGLL